jgi:hypothetical protein
LAVGSKKEIPDEEECMRSGRLKWLIAFVALLCLCSSSTWAGTIALEGSDATAFHKDGVYTEQLFDFFQGASGLPVLILGGVALNTSGGEAGLSPADATMDTNGNPYSLTGVTNYVLSNYSAVYIETPSGCCTQDPTEISPADRILIGAAEAAVAGLSVGIENYGGGDWGAILPAAVDALPVSDFNGSSYTSYVCTDAEVFNANGIGHGFTQPPVLGCYEHQAYKTSAFTGFISLVDADPTLGPTGGPAFGADGSAFLALGGALGTPSVPEPSTLLMLGMGLLSLAGPIKRKLLRRS